MVAWHEYIQRNATIPEWPYPIRYGHETLVETDVLVLGGGIAGCHAAINARRQGVRVAVVEKGATKWSGNGGAGVDHWISACTNPCSQNYAGRTHRARNAQQRRLRLRTSPLCVCAGKLGRAPRLRAHGDAHP